MDLNGDRKLKKREVIEAFTKMGHDIADRETRVMIMGIFKKFDTNNDGEISREEFEREIAIGFEREQENQ